MKKRAQVHKIMTPNPITVNLTNSVKDVVNIFGEKKIRHIPVVSGSSLIGVISKTDIDRISFVTGSQNPKANYEIFDSLSLDQVMTETLDTVKSDDEIRDAAKLLATGSYHALPVMTDGELVGILTSTDVINYLLEQY